MYPCIELWISANFAGTDRIWIWFCTIIRIRIRIPKSAHTSGRPSPGLPLVDVGLCAYITSNKNSSAAVGPENGEIGTSCPQVIMRCFPMTSQAIFRRVSKRHQRYCCYCWCWCWCYQIFDSLRSWGSVVSQPIVLKLFTHINDNILHQVAVGEFWSRP